MNVEASNPSTTLLSYQIGRFRSGAGGDDGIDGNPDDFIEVSCGEICQLGRACSLQDGDGSLSSRAFSSRQCKNPRL
ncbi:hypothetical protein, partial [Burkholderia diffusa]|uniref:hypothetical protein n=1 Tax=Burkholderia diffusa TaxID=488732 RepID=UPI002ABD5D44